MDRNSKLYCRMYSSWAFRSGSYFNHGGHGLNCLHKKRRCPAAGQERDETIESIMESGG